MLVFFAAFLGDVDVPPFLFRGELVPDLAGDLAPFGEDGCFSLLLVDVGRGDSSACCCSSCTCCGFGVGVRKEGSGGKRLFLRLVVGLVGSFACDTGFLVVVFFLGSGDEFLLAVEVVVGLGVVGLPGDAFRAAGDEEFLVAVGDEKFLPPVLLEETGVVELLPVLLEDTGVVEDFLAGAGEGLLIRVAAGVVGLADDSARIVE